MMETSVQCCCTLASFSDVQVNRSRYISTFLGHLISPLMIYMYISATADDGKAEHCC
jgi:hypothetical protein